MMDQLPWGCCRLCAVPIDKNTPVAVSQTAETTGSTRQDVPAAAAAAVWRTMTGPVFVASSSTHGVVLCDMQPRRIVLREYNNNTLSSRDQPLGLCCYDDSVRLVRWNDNNDDDDDTTTTLFDFVQSMTPLKRYRILERDPMNSSDNDESTRAGFLGAPTLTPIPLLSVTLTTTSQDMISSDGLPSSRKDLFWSSMKRQMAGVCVAFSDQKITTELSIASSSSSSAVNHNKSGTVVCLRVQSVVASNHQDDTTEPLLYIILPSTRITILLLVQPPKTRNTAAERIISQPPPTPPSTAKPRHKRDPSVTHLLVDTVRCLRGSSKALVSKSFLLAGPPGVGKTFSVKQAYEICKTEGPTLLLSLGSMLGSGDSPSEVSRLLEKRFKTVAQACSKDNACVAILFIDECDALLSSDHVAGMLASVLDRCSQSQEGWQRLVVVAATNRVDSIPAFLRRPGRFDKEIHIGPPTVEERVAILEALISSNTGSSGMSSGSILGLAEACVGYVPADLAALVRRALALALEEGMDSIDPDLFQRAMMDVGASVLRDSSLSAPPGTSWDDIAGSLGAKTTLRQAIEWPRTKREPFRNLGLVPPKGILLYGPPGCAKTTLARAAAGASGSGFVSLSPADVYGSSYVGEAEATVRRAFKLARSATPCILFFDEIDSILGSDQVSAGHGMGRSSRGSSAESRVLSTFLNEMDGVDGSLEDGVLVLGATNRPGILDKALLRPGRFDKVIYVPPPDYEARLSILNMNCNANVNLSYLASDEVSGSMTGAEIVGACRAAAMKAIRLSEPGDRHGETVQVTQHHLEESLRATKPLLSDPAILDDFVAFEESCRR